MFEVRIPRLLAFDYKILIIEEDCKIKPKSSLNTAYTPLSKLVSMLFLKTFHLLQGKISNRG
jgi:hypothetical protein